VIRPANGKENNLIHAISQLSGLHSDFKTNNSPQTIKHRRTGIQLQKKNTFIHFLI